MLFFVIERRIALRLATTAAVILGAYSVAESAFRLAHAAAQPGFVPVQPIEAADPLNPAVFVHGGAFTAGSPEADGDVNPASPFATLDENERHVRLEGFWMQVHEVTNEEYRRFDPAHEFETGMDRHPVAGITWLEAAAYAEWLGGTLPTESQWEFAARGTEGRTYPWGDDEPTCDDAHYAGCEPRTTLPVMSHPTGGTPEGIHDLAGNVWEWVMPDWFEPDRTPVNKASRRQRGGSFVEHPFFLRAANRNNDFYAGYRSDTVGFRVVWPVD